MARIKGHIEQQKTIKLRVKESQAYREPVAKYIPTTKTLCAEVTAFYAALFLDDLSLLKTKSDDLYAVAEGLTITSKQRPEVKFPLPWDVPAMLRRACIKKAFGAVKSWHSNYKKWEIRKAKKLAKGKKFTENPPLPPRDYSNMHPVLYDGMYKDFDGNSIILKLWTGSAWVWTKQPLELEGRNLPEGWEWGSPTLVLKDKLHLHFPITKQIKSPQKLAEQAKDPSGMTICSVDLNLDGDIAVATILHSDDTGKVVELATLFVKGNDAIQHRRKRELGKIAAAYSRTNKGFGISKQGDSSNRWRKIKNRDDYESHRISKRLVQFAHKHGATVIVFECLTSLKPDKAKYSRRSNQKRAYWLKSKIVQRTQYKAFQNHGIITARVSPKNTSSQCAHCSEAVSRVVKTDYKALGLVNYQPGKPNYLCANGHRGNADLNAARNIGLRLFERYMEKPQFKGRKTGLGSILNNLPVAG